MKRALPLLTIAALFAAELCLVYGCSTLETIGCDAGVSILCAAPTPSPTPVAPASALK